MCKIICLFLSNQRTHSCRYFEFFLRGIGSFKTYATLQFWKIYKKLCLILAEDYPNIFHVKYSLFSILLFLNTHACTLLHIHKRRGFHQSSGRQHVESLNVLLAKYRGEGGTYQTAHNERDWLQLIHQHFLWSPPLRYYSSFQRHFQVLSAWEVAEH